MVATTLSLTVQTVSTVRWTLQNVISVCGQPVLGEHVNEIVEELNNREYFCFFQMSFYLKFCMSIFF